MSRNPYLDQLANAARSSHEVRYLQRRVYLWKVYAWMGTWIGFILGVSAGVLVGVSG